MALLPKDQKKQMQMLLGVGALLSAFLYYQFMYTGRVADIDTLEEQVATLQMKNDAWRAQVARFGQDLPRRIALYTEHVNQLEQLIPRREDVPMLINQITQQAHDLGVELAALNPAPEEPGDFYSRQTYEVHVLGEYHRVGEYLAGIGSLPRIIRSREMKISVETPDAERSRSPLLRAAFRIETYIIPGEAPTPTTNVNAN
jgi:type IV pilus assembly protein PilO